MRNPTIYTLDKEESQRIGIIKLIAIILVVYIHAYIRDGGGAIPIPGWLLLFENILSKGIGAMAVPIFFLISAILLFKNEHNYTTLLQKKFKRLFLPYVFWNSLWIVIFFIFQSFSFTRVFFQNSDNIVANFSIRDWLYSYGLSLNVHPFLGPFWFIRDLLVMTILYPLFRFIMERFPKLAVVLSIILFFAPEIIPYQLAMSLFLLGGCVVKYNVRMAHIDRFSMVKISILYGIAILANECFKYYIFYQINIVFGILFFIKLSKCIYDSNKLKNIFLKLIPYTFIIYAGHEMTISFTKKILLHFFPHSGLMLFSQYLVLPMLIICGCVFVGVILSKHMKHFYAFVTGDDIKNKTSY